MVTQRLDQALGYASSCRWLRDTEVGEARRARAVLERAGTPATRAFLARKVSEHIAIARAWNRHVVKGQRAVRRALAARHYAMLNRQADRWMGRAAP